MGSRRPAELLSPAGGGRKRPIHGARHARRRDVYGRAEVALVTAAEAAAADAAARERHGVADRVLMENAGRAAALVLDRAFDRGRIAVLAGSGNNGGDAVVAARALRSWGRDVRVVSCGSRPPEPSLLHSHPIEVEPVASAEAAIAWADVLVDGLLGTGSSGAPREPLGAIIERMNASDRPIFALDLPSGVDATTGVVAGVAVRAAVTASFGWPKLGCLLHPARAHCGCIIAVEIGFPPLTLGDDAKAVLTTPAWAASRLPARPPDAHKGSSGRLGILAGQEGMAGAAALAAEAARRAGAGLVRLASAAANRVILQSLVPEATFVDRTALVDSDFETVQALLAGPGIGTDDGAWQALDSALELTGDRPALLDADAVNLFARRRDGAAYLDRLAGSRDVVITPHPKELERLTGLPVREIQADRPAAARKASAQFGCTVLLKGQPSIIAAPDGMLLVNSAGSSDLAAGGMGDQLAGVIAAFLAAGLGSVDAAGAGLFFASRAADLAGRGRSLGPRDISDHFHEALASPGAERPPLGLPLVTFDQPPRW